MGHEDSDDGYEEEEEPVEEGGNDDELDSLNIEKGLLPELPLSERQLEFLRGTTYNFTYREMFYVFRRSGDLARRAIDQLKFIAGMLRDKRLMEKIDGELDVLMGCRKAAQEGGFSDPRDGVWYTEEDNLPEDAVEWGNTVADGAAADPAAAQAWGTLLSEFITKAKMDSVFAMKTEVAIIYGKSPPSESTLRDIKERCVALAQISYIDFDALQHARAKANFEYWEKGKATPPGIMEKWMQEYYDDPYVRPKIEEARENLAKVGAAIHDRNCTDPDCQVRKEKADANGNVFPLPPPPEDEEVASGDDINELVRQLVNTRNDNATQDNKGNNMADKKNTVNALGDKLGKQLEKFSSVNVMFTEDPNAQHINLPKGMDLDTAIYWLAKMKEEAERTYNFSYKFKDWYPLDAAWALYKAIAQVYGFSHVTGTDTFFGEIPPTMLTIETGLGTKQQVPWGPIEVRGLSGKLTPNIAFHNGLPCLVLSAVIKNSERAQADKLMQLTEEMLAKESIYKGKAVQVDFTIFTPDNINFDVLRAPTFIDTRGKANALVLPADIRELVEVNLWTPIEETQACLDNGIPIRRTVLLEGTFGTGKTLTAHVTSRKCEENGWTYLYLKDLKQLPKALYFAKKYAPCVIFAEDVDRVTEGMRDDEMDELLNTIDGVDRKNDKVMLVFTSNNVDAIHPAFMRPGRTDAIITFLPPDPTAVQELINVYGVEESGHNIIDPSADLTKVGKLLAGQIPAIIRETVERSKLAAVRFRSKDRNGKLLVTAKHLEIAAAQMLNHAKHLEEPEAEKPDLVVLGEAFGEVVASGLREYLFQNHVSLSRSDIEQMDDKEAVARGVSQLVADTGLAEVVEKNG
jgi:transitional endoplasmic reticulum ATPase